MSKARFPLALVHIAVGPSMLAEAVRLVVVPLACVLIVLGLGLPSAVTGFLSFTPETIVHVSVGPRVPSLTMHTAHLVLAFKDVAIAEDLEAHAVSFVSVPLALVEATGLVADDTLALALGIYNYTSVHTVFVIFHCKIEIFHELLPAEEFWTLWLVVEVLLGLLIVQLVLGETLLHGHVNLG